tara:strand:+ start:57 stop:266 length:210 start_codon:yes stop_codon:yes gene_type:complete
MSNTKTIVLWVTISIIIILLVVLLVYSLTKEQWSRRITGGFGYNPNIGQINSEYSIGYGYPTIREDDEI